MPANLENLAMATGLEKGQFSLQSQRKAMPMNAQTTTQLHSSHMLAWRRQWHPTPVLLPGKFHGQRSLVGCTPWGREESDTTERLHFPFSLSCIREGNGNPLQCSCLENPRDWGVWCTPVYAVIQRLTWLKWLSSSSSSRLHHEKCWTGRNTSWNQDCQEKYQ